MVAQTAISFGYFVGSLSDNIMIVQALAAPLMIPLMIFGGFYLNNDSTPIYLIWLKYLSWFYYANESLQINQWTDVEFDCKNCTGIQIPSEDCPKELKTTYVDVLTTYGFDEGNFARDVLLLLALCVGFRTLSLLILLFKFRPSNR